MTEGGREGGSGGGRGEVVLDGEDEVAGGFVDGRRTVAEGEEEGLREGGREEWVGQWM